MSHTHIHALYSECCDAECHYAECRYAECDYAECRCTECHYNECRYAAYRSAPKVLIYGSILAIDKQEEVMTPKITVSLKVLNG